MRFAFALLLAILALGCRQSKSVDQVIVETERNLAKRVRKLDTSKPPPELPIPKNPPKSPDLAKVRAESAKITALRIVEIEKGTGPEVTPGRYLSIHYVGTLPDGYLFDSSYLQSEPKPFTFLYDPAKPQVIQGWMQGLKGMRVGGRRKLYIPAKLGYGAQGSGPIPPNAALIFDVTLMFVGSSG